MKLFLATTSEIKRSAIENILNTFPTKKGINFTVFTKDVESYVPDTPYNGETIQGAKNRVNILCENFFSESDLFVGLESGLIERYGNVYEECWCVIKDKSGNEVFGYSSGFMLPKEVTSQMDVGKCDFIHIMAIAVKHIVAVPLVQKLV